jgi:soluble lytic murein transglycosylase
MTYDFSLQDIMGNFTGGPVDPNAMPNYDTVSTATTQTVTTAPAIPEQSTTYDRMLQAESGNRDYDAQGRPITSPKGAMFASQVMPSTAAAPGYGIKPAQSQTPEEYNRVGREYYQAMLKKFNGNEQAVAAAYNAGPGKVQQNISQNNGQLNVAQLPKETQSYVGKVFQGVGNAVNNMIPSAQASTLPPQPSAPQPNLPVMKPAVPETRTAVNPETGESYQQLVQPFTGQGLKFGGKTQEQLQQELQQQQQQKQNTDILNSNNQQDISKLAFDPNTPKDIQMAALNKLHGTMEVANSMEKAKQKMAELSANPDPRNLNKAMNDSKLGDYFKVLLYQGLNWHGKAQELLDRIDPKIVYGTSTLGDKNVVTKVNEKTGEVVGAVINGSWTTDPKILNEVMAQGGVSISGTAKSFLMPQTSGSPVTKTIDGKLVNGIQIYDPVKKSFYVQYGNQRDMNPQGWTSATQNTDQQRQLAEQKALIGLQKIHGTNVLNALKDFESQSPTPLNDSDRMAFIKQYGGLGVPGNIGFGGGQAAGGGAGGQAAPQTITDKKYGVVDNTGTPVIQSGEGTKAFEKRYKQWSEDQETTRKGKQEAVKKATDVVANADKIINELDKVNDAILTLQTKKTNFGTIIHGTLPGEQTLGKFFKTDDYANTMQVLDIVNKVAASNAKMLGTNPTDADLRFVTSTKPDETWSPQAVEEWMRRSAEGTRKTIDFARQQIQSGGTFIPETPNEAPTKTGPAPVTNKARRYNPATGQLE